MLKPGTILEALYERIEPAAEGMEVLDLRIGLGYVGVKLKNHSMGIAALLHDAIPAVCTALQNAGAYNGSPASSLLKYLVEGKNSLERAIGELPQIKCYPRRV
ncbi:MAG: DUF4213 domain-containing protein [Deltaproteobacteria bacterium]|nr:DUF4213 domain-containing protein [Deltaproteobacteria bacterium]